MASSAETRKDIFRLTSQGQLELPELTAKSSLNTIEFRANDGIYVNGVLLSSGGAPVGNTLTADYTQAAQPIVTVLPSVPLGRTKVTFDSLGYNFDHANDTQIRIPFTENPTKPFVGVTRIIPIVRQTIGRANAVFGTNIEYFSILNMLDGTFVLTISFGPAYGADGLMADYSLDIDFLVL